jgi:hypothetical protein
LLQTHEFPDTVALESLHEAQTLLDEQVKQLLGQIIVITAQFCDVSGPFGNDLLLQAPVFKFIKQVSNELVQ